MLPSSIVSADNLRVASDIPYPPWEFYDPATSKNPAGFDFDLSQAIGKKIGIPTSFNETPFDSIILSIKGGKNDMIMSDMYDNLEREQQGVSFVDYAYDGTSVLVKKGNPNGITNLDSLAGKTVACESGTTQQAFLQKQNTAFKSAGKSAMTILALPNQPAALLAVTSGRAVGDLTDHSTAAYIAQTTNSGNTLRGRRRPDRARRLRSPARGHRHRGQEHPAHQHRAEGAAGPDRRRRLPEDRGQVQPHPGEIGRHQPRLEAGSHDEPVPVILPDHEHSQP